MTMASPTGHEDTAPTEVPRLTQRALTRQPHRFLFGAVGVGGALIAVLFIDAAWSGVETGVIRASRRRRPPKDRSWTAIAENLDAIRAWLSDGLSARDVHGRLSESGVVVPLALVQRYATCFARSQVTLDLTDSAAARPVAPQRLVLVGGVPS